MNHVRIVKPPIRFIDEHSKYKIQRKARKQKDFIKTHTIQKTYDTIDITNNITSNQEYEQKTGTAPTFIPLNIQPAQTLLSIAQLLSLEQWIALYKQLSTNKDLLVDK